MFSQQITHRKYPNVVIPCLYFSHKIDGQHVSQAVFWDIRTNVGAAGVLITIADVLNLGLGYKTTHSMFHTLRPHAVYNINSN